MSEELVKSVQDMLKEETWTRAAISNYTKNNLIELAVIVEKAREEKCEAEIKAICDEHLTHSKDSIIALYISGILSLRDDALDNSALVSLVDFFKKSHKEAIVVYLCETILSEDENNKFALRTLAESYRAENNDKLWGIYEQIVKLDFEEADIAKLLAERYESQGDMENALDYYKKALLRYITAKNISSLKEIWTKLVSLIPQEIDFFLLAQRKIAKGISEDKSALLMQELYVWYKDNEKWDIAIEILKLVLTIDAKDPWARRELVDCFRGKYKDHSQLDDYIRSSNLTQSFRNVFEAISDFEKHIAFDAKHFVFHRSWGVGIIRKVENDTLTINFGKKNGIHDMSLKMAVSALTPLAEDHIWVLKATMKKDVLAKKVKEEKVWALKAIIKSFGNSCDFKRIKAELVPVILTPGEWTSWNSAAKKILATDASFGVNANDINQYVVRDHEISQEEKFSNEFKAQKQFFARIDIIMKYILDDATDKESELFADMYSYFIGFVKNITNVTEQVLASYLVVQRIGRLFPAHAYPIKYTFAQIYGDIEDPRTMYSSLKDTKNTSLKRDFLSNIKLLENWDDEYIKLFPSVLQGEMLVALVNAGKVEKIKKMEAMCFEDFKDYREAALYFFKECNDEDWHKECTVSYEKQLISLLNIIELTFREINNHLNTTENKKINKAAVKLLFKDEALSTYMFSNDESTVTKMYTLVDDIYDLEPTLKAGLRNRILDKYPDYKFHATEEKSVAPRGMLVTIKKLEEKKNRIEEIEKKEIPANAKEIADAKEKGDLKENQDYKAAKEHQHLLSVALTKLQEELSRAVVFDPTTATTAIVSFSTTVTLLNNDSGKEESYTILGPWESDPDNGIISYMSPIGNALMDKKVGEEAVFTINENTYNYKILSIKLAK